MTTSKYLIRGRFSNYGNKLFLFLHNCNINTYIEIWNLSNKIVKMLYNMPVFHGDITISDLEEYVKNVLDGWDR